MPNQSDAASKEGKQANAAPREAISADQVATYLRQHPNFLVEHPALLDILEAPEQDHGEGVIDLQQAMLQRLRAEVDNLTDARDALVVTGRSNLNTQARTHDAVLSILGARSFEQFIHTITTDLAVKLDLDVATIAVEQSDDSVQAMPAKGIFQLDEGTLEELLGTAPMLLRENIAGDPEIFGPAAGLVQSDALIRLSISAQAPKVLLALGSRQPDQFHPGQGTELLNFLAKVLECSFRTWLSLPRT